MRRVVSTVITRPPFWLRPSYKDFNPTFDHAGAIYSSVTLAVLVTAFVVGGVLAWRRHDRVTVAAVAIAVTALIAAVITAATLPASSFGLVASNFRWLWPIGAFVAIAGATAVIQLELVGSVTLSARAAQAGVVVAVSLGVASIPSSYQQPAREDLGSRPIGLTRKLLAQLDHLDERNIDDPLLIDRTHLAFGSPYAYPLMIKLQQLGIDFDVLGETDIKRFGEARRDHGAATTRLTITSGVGLHAPKDAQLVARVRGLYDDDYERLERLTDDVLGLLRDQDVKVDIDAAEDERGARLTRIRRYIEGRDVDRESLVDDVFWVHRHGYLTYPEDAPLNLQLVHDWDDLYRYYRTETASVWISRDA